MSAVLFLSLLLLGTPVQSVEDSSEIQQLRKQVEVLESRIAKHEARAESFTDILSSQRSTFGWGITLITILATALFGFVGWGIFEWRAGYVEQGIKDRVKAKINEMKSRVDIIEDKVSEMEKEIEDLETWKKDGEIKRFRQIGYYPLAALKEIEMVEYESSEKGLTDSEKTMHRIESIEHDLNQISRVGNGFPEGMKAECISKMNSLSAQLEGESKRKLDEILERMKEEF